MKNLFSENLKKLRKTYNETQKELADKIGVAPNYICMLEKGSREMPSTDIVMAIANHYHITVETLLSPIENDGYTLKNIIIYWDEEWKTLCELFPIFGAEKLLEDELFKVAHKRHKEILLKYKNKHPLDVEQMLESMKQYDKSWENNNTIESLANILSILCVLCGSIGTKEMQKAEDHLRDYGFLCGKKLARVLVRKDNRDDPLEEAKRVFVNQYEVIIDKCFLNLKRDSAWADVADYYLCIAYMVGMVENDYGIDTNRNFGFEMMQRFAIMGNSLAMEYIELLISEKLHN
ncbi:MAG: helix-turn-helix transcriptional regulator [Clostridia bacterium]|nr:helix-turn-helix transcriptional regulator [Clostridia bacterium]